MNSKYQMVVLWILLILGMATINWMLYPNPIVRPRLERIEPFQSGGAAPVIDPEGSVSGMNSLAPMDPALQAPRAPFSLLTDVIPPFEGSADVGPTSKMCYEADFQTRIERTGNYRQLTNNYKRAVPDSCSAPNHDMLLSFYKVQPLAAA